MTKKSFCGEINLCMPGLTHFPPNPAFEQEMGSLCFDCWGLYPMVYFGGWVILGQEMTLFFNTWD